MPAQPAIALETLRDAVGADEVRNAAPVAVTDIAYDTRKVGPGALFVCVPGARADGHDFAEDAVAEKASILVLSTGQSASVRSAVRHPSP